ncbi:MAG: ThiF family adenylyltransferase [Candidatus Micrarchaeota archaeon]|nr:ThiF family adenylyltransferase [Candidatus Micrarchaeota archaeon]
MRLSSITKANLSSIGKEGQEALLRSCIGVAGLGGVGGIAFQLLLRAGAGKMKISDCGFFEQSNANRQALWSIKNDGRSKVEAAMEFARGTNPGCKIEAFGKITKKNAGEFARGCDAIVDATDSLASRLAVFSGCEKQKVPYIFASARGSRGMLTVFLGKDFRKEVAAAFPARRGLPCDHALGPVANAIGCLAAQQAMNLVLGKPAILFPDILLLDAFSSRHFRMLKF